MHVVRRRLLPHLVLLPAALAAAGCAGFADRPGPQVDLAGMDSLPGEGLEVRFMLKLRVQNPGDADMRYDGVWVDLDLRGQKLASGGAPLVGVVPRFGERVLSLPVTASGLSIARQVISLMQAARSGKASGPVSYALRGRLGGLGLLGQGRFESRGEIDLSAL